jgi:hypothetical protein
VIWSIIERVLADFVVFVRDRCEIRHFSVFFFSYVCPGFRAPGMKIIFNMTLRMLNYIVIYAFLKKKTIILGVFLECAAFYFSALVLAARGIFFDIFFAPLCFRFAMLQSNFSHFLNTSLSFLNRQSIFIQNDVFFCLKF